jgi:polynucleotide 5'-kinase involved in rRNA processing
MPSVKINLDAYSYTVSKFEEFPIARIYTVLGGIDVGKTSFSISLAVCLLRKNYEVFFLDLDLGQSTIGLPITIALGRLELNSELDILNAEDVNLEFIGNNTPDGLEPLLIGRMYRLLSLVPKDAKLVVDTCGFVRSSKALGYKRMIIEALPESLTIIISKEYWTQKLFSYIPGEKVLIPPLPNVKRRDFQIRKERRESLMKEYFSKNLTLFMVPLEVCYFPYPFVTLKECLTNMNNMLKYTIRTDDLLGVIVGLRDKKNKFMGLGRVIDFKEGRLLIETPISSVREVYFVELSSIRLDDQYKELGKILILEKEE